ncbi:hypothetical protein IFM89_007575 [Coptis chinensis]|uniref:Uncharacterized protein n=1 Tax=Coptis chinensis TaxID=261450 RepID=A0A835I021_9MAGN|nr:hypothetical protein IFM89_007575 [Coptis chinensis]
MKHIHDRKLRERVFKPGDWVLRKAKNFDNPSAGKFSENWEGPFIVDRLASKEAVTSTTPSACGCSLEPRITTGKGGIEVDLEMVARGECKPELRDLKLGSGCLVIVGGTSSSSEEY